MLRAVGVQMGVALRAFGRALPTMLIDGVGLGAVATIAYGAWLIAPPAGFIVGGALLLVGVVLVSLHRRGSRDEDGR